MNTQPGEEPSSGPNYFNFDPTVKYSFGIDNNGDGKDDITLDFQFRNEIRGAVDALGLPLSYLGNVPNAVPPITRLDGPGSEGLGLRQRYTITMSGPGSGQKTLARDLIAVPSNVGPRTMPNYPLLASQGINTLPGGIKVFAGQREDPFYIDLGGVFDTLNFRRAVPLLSDAEDANDNVNPFGVDMLSGFNVQTIAIEIPISMLTNAYQTLGGYAYTSRPNVTVRGQTFHSRRQVGAGPAARQPADQRGHHRHQGQGRVELLTSRSKRASSSTTTSTRGSRSRSSSCSGRPRPRAAGPTSSTRCSSTGRAIRTTPSWCGSTPPSPRNRSVRRSV